MRTIAADTGKQLNFIILYAYPNLHTNAIFAKSVRTNALFYCPNAIHDYPEIE